MGFYGRKYSSVNEEEFENINMDELMEEFMFIEFSQLPDEKLQQFLVSEDCKMLCEAGLIGKNTMVRLSKSDDLSRRIKMAALQSAKDNNDNLWKLWDNFTEKKNDVEAKILQKYNTTATKLGRIGQKSYLKTHRISQAFVRS
jgi:hypothetical protein